MISKFTAFLLIAALICASVPAVAARDDSRLNDWDSLKSYLNNEVAVEVKKQKTVFGILLGIDDDELRVRTANNNTEVSFKRAEVGKVWLATLKGSRKTLKGAAIGAGIGAGIGLGAVLAGRNDPNNDDGLIGATVPLLAIPGALIGGAIGFFSRQKNKKNRLVYQQN